MQAQQEPDPPLDVNAEILAQQLTSLQAVLLRIGLTQGQVDAFCNVSGCINIAMMGLLSADQVLKTCKRIATRTVNPIQINTVQEQLLLGLCFWVTQRQQLHQPIVTGDFTMFTALNQAQLMRQQAEDDARLDKEVTAKMPDKFKVAFNWKVFSEAVEPYLTQILGSGRIPLSYVIRQLDVPDPGAIYDTQLEENIASAPHRGASYQRDNAKV
jgi:hypothetical protein